jgi:hypothetical protein
MYTIWTTMPLGFLQHSLPSHTQAPPFCHRAIPHVRAVCLGHEPEPCFVFHAAHLVQFNAAARQVAMERGWTIVDYEHMSGGFANPMVRCN